MITTTWADCYDDRWTGFIVPASFAHPAKYSKALIERIYDHCLALGWLSKGDRVGDCFGGVATGGLIAAYRGLEWVGVELEPRFVDWARQNINLHRGKLVYLSCPLPKIVQGDSRNFHEIVGEVCGVVTSPPFNENSHNAIHGQGKGSHSHDRNESKSRCKKDYVRADSLGNIGELRPGAVDAVITSPPYAQTGVEKSSASVDMVKNWETYKASGGGSSFESYKATQEKHSAGYGHSEGQISRLNGGSVEAVVTSPPFEDRNACQDPKYRENRTNSGGPLHHEYGDEVGQIGKNSGETYWSAMAQVYASCFLAIKPGGFIAVVVKDYVKNKQVVPLCNDTARLLEHCGFVIVERVHAMLVKKTSHDDLFSGATTQTKSRKSFFRRLAEAKGSPEINFEEVIFAKRP